MAKKYIRDPGSEVLKTEGDMKQKENPGDCADLTVKTS